MPVPYNLDIELYAMAKNSDDALQIVEQILPFFQPDYTLTINDMTDMGIKRDIPIVLNSVSYEDSYRGDYAERSNHLYTCIYLKVLSIRLLLLQKSSRLCKLTNMQIYKTKHQRESRDTQLHLTLFLLMQMTILVLMKLYLSSKMQRIEI